MLATGHDMTKFPDALARELGTLPPLPDGKAPEAEMMIDYALRYARMGLCIFPVSDYTGVMLIDRWHHHATRDEDKIVDWWSQWPEADIACVPGKSGHFAIMTVGEEGQTSFDALEEKFGTLDPVFTFEKGDTVQYWFAGSALSSSNKLGKNVFVIGPGRFLFLPPSSSKIRLEYADERSQQD